jgi:sugar fermentation stimulation protein A
LDPGSTADGPDVSPGYRYAPHVIPVRIELRLHRFGARVRGADGRTVVAHVPNPGRMRELLLPGARGWMVPSADPLRRTAGTLVVLRHGRTLVSIDTQLPNRLVAQRLVSVGGARTLGVADGPWRPEVRYGASRMDFGISGATPARPRALLEVKSANLRVGGAALFPDAPTVRGTRHVRELARAARTGTMAFVLFVVQRADVGSVGPHRRMDPAFGSACDEAVQAGVTFGAVQLVVRPGEARLGRRVPVRGLVGAPKMSM